MSAQHVTVHSFDLQFTVSAAQPRRARRCHTSGLHVPPCARAKYFVQVRRAVCRAVEHLQFHALQMARHQGCGFRCIAGVERDENRFVILERTRATAQRFVQCRDQCRTRDEAVQTVTQHRVAGQRRKLGMELAGQTEPRGKSRVSNALRSRPIVPLMPFSRRAPCPVQIFSTTASSTMRRISKTS